MYAKSVVLAFAALAAARFGQEGLVQNAIQGLSNVGSPGQAATLAGQTPGVLLGGANACAKVCATILYKHARGRSWKHIHIRPRSSRSQETI